MPKNYRAVILGKRHIYREFGRNGSGGVYSGNEAQAMSEQRWLDNKPSPNVDDHALMNEITALFKKDRPADHDFRPVEGELPLRAGKAGFNIGHLQACIPGNGGRAVAERTFQATIDNTA